MMQFKRRIFLLFLFLTFAGNPVQAEDLLPGVNRPGLAWVQDKSAAMATLGTISKEQVPAVRIMLVRPFDRVACLIEQCNQVGVNVLLMIPLAQGDYYPKGTVPRIGIAPFYTLPPFSQLDTALFAAKWNEALQLFINGNLRIHAFEIANEFNTSVFNGDLPVLDRNKGIVVTNNNFHQQAFWTQYLKGMLKLAAVSDIIFQSIRISSSFQKATIILGGLARPETEWVKKIGAILIEPYLALKTLRDFGIDNSVDAYAIHIYPHVPKANWQTPEKDIASSIDEHMNRVVGFGALGKPWWITEWGFAMQTADFENCDKGDPRLKLFSTFTKVLAASPWRSVVEETYIYDWDESTRFRIWNDNSVLCSSFRQVFK